MTAAQKAQQSTPPAASAHEKILIVDFGSQVTQRIARRVREEGVYSEIVPFQKAEAAFLAMKPKAVILSGGPESVHEAGSPRAPQAIFDSGVPVLGICYGQMTMAHQLGGEVEGGHHREFGRADVEVKGASQLFDATWDKGGKYQVWMSHGDRITRMPPGFVVAGTSANAPFAVMAALDLAAELGGHGHLAVADAEHGNAGLEDQLRRARRTGFMHRLWTAGEDHRFRLHLAEGGFGLLERHDLGIDALLAHPARDQLRHLTAEIDDQNLVMRRGHVGRRLAGFLCCCHVKPLRDGWQARNCTKPRAHILLRAWTSPI